MCEGKITMIFVNAACIVLLCDLHNECVILENNFPIFMSGFTCTGDYLGKRHSHSALILFFFFLFSFLIESPPAASLLPGDV